MNDYIDTFASKKPILIGLTVVVAIVFSALGYLSFRSDKDDDLPPAQKEDVADSSSTEAVTPALRPEDAEYSIEGKRVRLQGGYSEQEIAKGPTIKEIVRVFGNTVFGDLDADGDADSAFFLKRETSGSGTFYYVAAALNSKSNYSGMEVFLLGDRIAPQTVTIRDGLVIANYAERKSTDPMSALPRVAVSKYLMVAGSRLEETLPPGAQK